MIQQSIFRRCGPFRDHEGREWPGLWSARVTVFEGARRLWSETSPIQRVSPADARHDAQVLADDLTPSLED